MLHLRLHCLDYGSKTARSRRQKAEETEKKRGGLKKVYFTAFLYLLLNRMDIQQHDAVCSVRMQKSVHGT